MFMHENMLMHEGMAIDFTCNPGVDFVRGMIQAPQAVPARMEAAAVVLGSN